MPRKRRDWEPGDLLSVVGRAHEGRPIFATDDDRRFFVERLTQVFVPPDVDLLAWSVLSNHYHLVIRVRDAVPGALFLRLNTVLAQRERRRRGDHGAVFQDRFWTRPCREEEGLVPLLTYVLGNPAHHGVVPTAEALESHVWTAYADVLGRREPRGIDPRESLALLHPDAAVARPLLREAMARRVAGWQAQRAGVDVCEEPGCRGGSDGCSLIHVRRSAAGARDATEPPPSRAPTAWISTIHDERAERRARCLADGWEPAGLVAAVCARLGVDARAVLRGGRHRAASGVRAVVAYVACDGLGVTGARAAALLGVSGTGVTAARRRGRRILEARGWRIDDVVAWSSAAAQDPTR